MASVALVLVALLLVLVVLVVLVALVLVALVLVALVLVVRTRRLAIRRVSPAQPRAWEGLLATARRPPPSVRSVETPTAGATEV